jgi:glycosyltransferase involved in cell wall biosynthesis
MMPEENIEFDVCFVTFNKIDNDARTINMSRVLSENGKKVCIIGLSEDEPSDLHSNKMVPGGNDPDTSHSFKRGLGGDDSNTSHSFKRGLGGDDPDTSPSFKRGLGGVLYYKIKNSSHPKMWNRWLSFSKETKRIKPLIKSKIFIAEDLYSLHIVCRLAKKQNSKFIYDSREIYSALGPLYKNKIKQKILSTYEKYYIRYVDEVIVSGKLDGEYLKDYLNHDIPYHVIMNLPFFNKPIESNVIREKYKISDNDIAIIYQGMILPGRGVDLMIEALQYIKNVHFFILGEGGYEAEYNSLSKDLQVYDRVHFCGLISYEELHKWTCSADIGLVYIEPISFSYELALPNKLFEYCMAGVPSLVSDLPAMREVLFQDEIGLLLKVGIKTEQIADSIRSIYENREQYIANCKIASRKYNYESQKEIILGMCET